MATYDLDCLFVHVPKADNHYLPIGDFFNITYMPMGVPAMAELLHREGRRVEICHLGVEWLVDRDESVERIYEGRRIRAIGFPLYWHYQAYDTIQVAAAMAKAHPEAFIFLGGITAGYFADEIIDRYRFIDAVVRGHGESVVADVVAALCDGASPESVPNLTLRDPETGAPGETGKSASSAIPLDDLVFGDLGTMRHAEVYAASFGFPLAYAQEHTPDENRSMLSMGRAFFPLFVGRGCPWICSFCGGNRGTLAKVTGTAKVVWRSQHRVVDDIRLARDLGYRTMALCFDPTPTRDEYYVELFRRIREARLDVDFYFECWGLPTPRFVREFRRTFPSPESYIAISPDAGDEHVRRLNKQPFYTDAELLATLRTLDELEISADVFFTLALPGERLGQARRTAELKREIATTFRNARRVMTWTVQLEPGSPQFERPSELGMLTDRNCFADFYEAHGGKRADTYSSLGYKILDYFGDERDEGEIEDFERHMQHLKCLEFCFLAKDPRQWNAPAAGRRHCFDRRTELARRRGHAPPRIAIGADAGYESALAEEARLRGDRPRRRWVPEQRIETEVAV